MVGKESRKTLQVPFCIWCLGCGNMDHNYQIGKAYLNLDLMRSRSSEFTVRNIPCCFNPKPRLCGSMQFTVLFAKQLVAEILTKSSFFLSFHSCLFSFLKQLERRMLQPVYLSMWCMLWSLTMQHAGLTTSKNSDWDEFINFTDIFISL